MYSNKKQKSTVFWVFSSYLQILYVDIIGFNMGVVITTNTLIYKVLFYSAVKDILLYIIISV